LPTGTGWPVLVFIHGGRTSGDKGLTAGGADIYGNIGRFYACRGSASRSSATPATRGRVDGAARRRRARGRMGARERRALRRRSRHDHPLGHSAGAQFAARVALDPAPLAALGIDHQ
jgi:hypothetical protein